MDEARPARSYETPPTRVERRGGRASAAVVALAVVAFVAVALAKPWGGGAAVPSGAPASPSVPSAPSAVSSTARPVAGAPLVLSAGRPAPTPGVLHDPDVGLGASSGGLGGSSEGVAGSDAGGLGGSDAGPIGPLVARLAEHSGDWGIGSGAWRPDSQLPWIDWRPAVPIPDDSADPRAALDCRDLPVVGGGIVVAITAPASIVPDWTVETLWFDRAGRPEAASVRQMSPPGNRGIAYLVRTDGKVWPSGVYRFRISASRRVLDLDACLSWS